MFRMNIEYGDEMPIEFGGWHPVEPKYDIFNTIFWIF